MRRRTITLATVDAVLRTFIHSYLRLLLHIFLVHCLKIMSMLFLISMAATLTLVLGARLPSSWLGHWHGVPTYTSAGPRLQSAGGISFTIAAIDDSHWFMEDNVGDAINLYHSQQQFFIQAYENGTDENYGLAEYCGWLAGYYLNMPHHGPVFNMALTRMSSDAMTFKYNKSMQAQATLWMPWNVEWWWNMIDNNTMTSFIQLPSGPEYSINHVLVNLTRISADPMPHLSAQGRAIVESKQTKSVCNFTRWPIPLPPQSATKEELDTALDGDKPDPRIMCPHGFTSESHGPMPQFIKDRLNARRQLGLPTLGDNPDDDGPQVTPATTSEHLNSHATRQYQYCIRLSTFHNFTVEYTYNTQTQAVDVMLSGRPKFQAASASWIAIGIMPAWPSMLGMDIVLGYFAQSNTTQACTRSMYAAHNAGTPVDNPSQQVTPVSIFTSSSDEVLHMQFSRPWRTGNWDLSLGPVFNESYPFIPIPVVAWSMGPAPADCTSDPHYHNAARGTHGFSWPAPKSAIIPQAFCNGQWPKS